MSNLPSGTVTLLFTDIEGSTKLAQQYPGAMLSTQGHTMTTEEEIKFAL